MTDSESGSNPKKSPAWLIASVILNVFLIGLIVGSAPRYWFHGGPGGRPGMHHNLKFDKRVDLRRGGGEFQFMYGAMQNLPQGMQEKFKNELGSMRKELRPVIKDMHDNIDATITAFTADPIDTEALRTAFDKQNATRQKIESLTQSAILEFINGLSDEERRQLSAAIKSSWERHQAMRARDRDEWRKQNRPNGPSADDYPGSPPPDDGPARE